MARPILMGIVGDSASGKTTLTRGLVRILGESRVTHISGDHYLRYDRAQRAQRELTPLDPASNYLDILEQHVWHLRTGEPILKPHYDHRTGTLSAPEYVEPADFVIVEGMLALHTPLMREAYDVRVFLDPPEDLRRRWKLRRDCTRRGYTTDQVLEELDRREPDVERVLRPQRRFADIVLSFVPREDGEDDDGPLGAMLRLRAGLTHPDLSVLEGLEGEGVGLHEREGELCVSLPGDLEAQRSVAIEELIWDQLHFASHLRIERLGEFTEGTELRRSESLAVMQLLLLYQLITARAAVAVGAGSARVDGAGASIEG